MRPTVKKPILPKTDTLDTLVEFPAYLNIDKDNLTEAMAAQADLFFRVGEEYAIAISEREEAKERVAIIDAELGQDSRLKKGKVGKAKEERLTESAIKDLIQINPKHLQAFEAYTATKKRAERFTALRDAFQERGRMLRDLGQLYAAGYFSITVSKGAAADIGRARLNEARGRTQDGD